jgi:RNA polymerase sigma-70 factor (ECF subfamily)
MNARSDGKQGAEARDRLLLERIADGDRDALVTLYDSYHERLCEFLYHLTRHAEMIDEVINECFRVVWQEAANFQQASLVSTWIFGIAYCVGSKTLRQRNCESDDGDNATPDPIPSSASDGIDLRDWITNGLARLTPDQHLVFELVYGVGHSLDEVAAFTGTPLVTVKARLFQARVNLRSVLPVFGD